MASEEMNMGMNWGIVIFFLILFFIFAGGGNWFNRGGNQPNSADLMTMLQSEGAMGGVVQGYAELSGCYLGSSAEQH